MERLGGSRFSHADGLTPASEVNVYGVTLGRKRVGWGGRIRTFTILINSEVSYRLDHAPAAFIGRPREKPGQQRFAAAAAKDSARIARHRPSAGVERVRATHKDIYGAIERKTRTRSGRMMITH